jgi:hypothetical protein
MSRSLPSGAFIFSSLPPRQTVAAFVERVPRDRNFPARSKSAKFFLAKGRGLGLIEGQTVRAGKRSTREGKVRTMRKRCLKGIEAEKAAEEVAIHLPLFFCLFPGMVPLSLPGLTGAFHT